MKPTTIDKSPFREGSAQAILVTLALLHFGCSGDAEEKLDNPTQEVEGSHVVCFGQIVATATAANGDTQEIRHQFPQAGWIKPDEGPDYFDDNAFRLFLGTNQDVACGLPDDPNMTEEEFVAYMQGMGAAPCVCLGPDDTGRTEEECLEACEDLRDLNPAYANASGEYECQNSAEVLHPDSQGGVKFGHTTTASCNPADAGISVTRQTQALNIGPGSSQLGSNGGPTQFMATGSFRLRAADDRVSANGFGILQYNVDTSDGCVDGCQIVINRLSMRFANSSYDRWNFTNTYVTNQEPLYGTVSPSGVVSIPSESAQFLVQFDSNSNTGNFVDRNSRAIIGDFNPVTGDLSLSSVVVNDGDLDISLSMTNSTVFAVPPVANFGPTGTMECNDRFGRQVTLSAAGTFDPDGDLGPLHWVRNNEIVNFGDTTTVYFPLGENEVALNAFDQRGALSYKKDIIEIVDTTAPVWGEAPLVDFTSCDEFVDTHTLIPPDVSDVCTDVVEIRAERIETDGVPLPVPEELNYDSAVLPGGHHVIRWTAWDTYNNQSSILQEVRLSPAILATARIEVRDRATVLNQSGAPAAIGSTGSETSMIGVQAEVAEILSFGPIFVQNHGTVFGRAMSRNQIDLQVGASVGVLLPFATVPLGNIPWLGPYLGAVFGSGYNSIERRTDVYGDGAHGAVSVKSDGRLEIVGSFVSFTELSVEPGGQVYIQNPNTTIVVRDRFVNRGSFTGNGAIQLVVLGQEVGLDAPMSGVDLVAPNARVTLGPLGSSLYAFRQIVGRTIEVQPDVTVHCDRTSVLSE